MTTPNRIVLISRGRHEEYPADADVYPGQIVQLQSDGGIIPHASVGGDASPLRVIEEDALQGGTINTKTPSGNVAMVRVAAKGDKLLMKLAIGQAVLAGAKLMSDGLGSLTAILLKPFYQIVAPSTVITNNGAETAFSNGSYTIPANTFQVGDVLRVHGRVFCIAENSTNTHRIRLYIGAGPTTLVDSTALALAASDFVEFDLALTIRTITSSGTFIASGTLATSVSGTVTTEELIIASTAIDSTLAQTLVIKSLASAASAGNQIRLDEFRVSMDRAVGPLPLAEAAEAIDNSVGSMPAFIRCVVE